MAADTYDWLTSIYKHVNESSDPRIKDWLFMDGPLPLFILSICYLYFVCKAGPQYMKDKKPYNLKTAITAYNLTQILSCSYLIYGFTTSGSLNPFSCEAPSYSASTTSTKVAKLLWWTVMLKLLEYIETVFFVLRKKQSQVSGLHLYHHVSTLMIVWYTLKFAQTGVAITPIVINSFVHVLMYSYYLVALLGGKDLQRKIVFLKRSLTILQMVQFTIMILHLLSGVKNNCIHSKTYVAFMLTDVFINYYMFYKFYKKAYRKKTV